jgi:predicted TIM-barrel fold metal-dependent hydrolase
MTQSSRREFVKTMAAAAILAQRGAPPLKTGRIDVHHHRTTVGGGGRGEWTPERSLEEMGKYEIDVAITSVSASGPALYDGTEKGNAFARTSNEQGAKMVQQYPGRFGLFLALPMNHIEGTLKEIAYGYDTLKADGVHIYSSIGEKWPGDPMYMPIYEELNRRKAIIFFHPTPPLCCKLPPGIGAPVVEYDFDVTRGITSLLWNGVLSKFPDIRFIIVHSGGTLPVLAGRIQDRVPRKGPDLYPTGTLELLKKQYYECAHATFPWALAALMKFTSTSNIMFGTDYPQEPIESTTKHLPENGFSAELLHAINRGNAERVFPRFGNAIAD